MITKFPTVYAGTDDGLTLPVVDVTNPSFVVSMTDAQIDAQAGQFVAESASRGEMPTAVREALARSILGQALMSASGSFLSGMHTYLLKLGPEHLSEPFTEIDRRIVSSFPGFATRIRLQDMARLIADGVAPMAEAWPGRPIRLINIAGGPAADSWNALIHVHAEQPGALAGRGASIAVLDPDDRGPHFGARAVEALTSPAGPLSGVAIDFRHVPYDWEQADELGPLVAELSAGDAACAISSEGGLFEYGSDAVCVANLAQMHDAAPADAIVVGSVTRDAAPTRAAQAASRVPTHPRTLDAFAQLARQGGWAIDKAIERPFTYNVRLAKAR
jgi:hypothetical protein